jgi:hypothetical protein
MVVADDRAVKASGEDLKVSTEDEDHAPRFSLNGKRNLSERETSMSSHHATFR